MSPRRQRSRHRAPPPSWRSISTARPATWTLSTPSPLGRESRSSRTRRRPTARAGTAGAGSIGLASAFSFYPSKNLGGFGDGGAVCARDPAVASRARELRNLGQTTKSVHAVDGYNERLDTLQAAVLRIKLRRLDEWNAARREAAAWYRGQLAPDARSLPERERAFDVHHLFPVRLRMRDQARTALSQAGVETGIHYPRPATPRRRMPPLGDPSCRWRRGGLARSSRCRCSPGCGRTRRRRSAIGWSERWRGCEARAPRRRNGMRQIARRLKDGRIELVEVERRSSRPARRP